MRVTVGLELDGGAVGAEGERGRLGEPVWGPLGLLRDLEIRLGLWVDRGAASEGMRVQRWARRLAALAPAGPFYARSFAVDPIGTARMTLAWRDGLVEAGWQGTAVPSGGTRLDTFAALEAVAEPAMPHGIADRLAAVEVEVALLERAPYEELAFVEERTLWPYRWQRVFDLLAERGAVLRQVERLRGAAEAGSDLRRLQAAMTDDNSDGDPADESVDERCTEGVRGDGSLVLLRAATTLEAADAVAAMVAGMGSTSAAIIRGAQETILDEALVTHGGRTLGVKPASRWRAALQVLPIAIELTFDPVDPRRVLELLGLAVSPFARTTRYMLSAALSDAPGLGGPRWREAKRRLHELLAHRRVAAEDDAGESDAVGDGPTPEGIARADREVALIEAWLESPRHDAREGAPTPAIVEAVVRVGDWLRGRMASGRGDAIEAAAFAQCEELRALVTEDGRARWDRLAVRQALDEVTADGAVGELTIEQAGRIDHVGHPGALLAPRDTLIWWHFVGETARPPHRARWRRTELEALAACGAAPSETAALLAQETRWWRNAVLAARRRLILVVAETDRGERSSPHPLWDEIVARLGLDERGTERITVRVADLLANGAARPSTPRSLTLALRSGRTGEGGASAGPQRGPAEARGLAAGRTVASLVDEYGLDEAIGLLLDVHGIVSAPDAGVVPAEPPIELATEELTALPLPPARATWHVQPGLIAPATRWTPASVQHLLECPLRWVLGQAAGVHGGSVPALPDGQMLNGSLGHRVVEELIATGGLRRAREEVMATIDRLLPEAAAWLLQPGLALELEQLRHQLAVGVEALGALLEEGGLDVASVEEAVAGSWLGGELEGRLDLRLRDGGGRDVILDMKWGHGSHRDLLAQGRAVQLACYAQALRTTSAGGRVPPAAYFSLGRGRLLAGDVEPFGSPDNASSIEGPTIEETLDRVELTVPRVQDALAAGEVHATGLAASGPLLDMLGVDGDEQERHYRVPPRSDRGARGEPLGCQYCRFGPLCGRAWEGA